MALADWIAPDQDQTQVRDPIYIDYTLIAELLQYHPTLPAQGVCTFTLKADPANAFAQVVTSGKHWHPKWVELVEGLELRAVPDDFVGEILEDNRLQPVKFGPGEWQVKNWRVVRTQDAAGLDFLQDIITWTNGQREGLSTYGWFPY
ncbi:MAG: hypothetical protein KDI19_15720 [Pseudomonadales bacterium]|nr:hypothetical protein [Pseudomonadales bacterium]